MIPLDNNNKISIDRIELLNSLKRISIYANKTTNQVRFKVSGSELLVSSEDLDFSNEANERLSCDHEGDDIEIGFNARYLLEIAQQIEGDIMQMALSDSGSPSLISTPGDEHNLFVLMPMRV